MSDRIAPLLLPFMPARAAARIGHTPRWAVPLVAVVILQVLLEFAAHPLRAEQTIAHIPRSATREELLVVRAELDAALAWELAILPVRESAAAAAGALVLGLILAAVGAGQRPRAAQLFAVVIGLGGIGVVEKGAEIAFLAGTGQFPALPIVPWSALALAGPTAVPYPVGLLLTMINLFTLWYVSALARALAVLCNIRNAHAFLIAIVFRTVTAGCAIAVLHLLRNAYVFTL